MAAMVTRPQPAKKRRTRAAPAPPLSADELTRKVLQLLDEGSSLTAAALRRALPKAQQGEGLAVARELAARGRCHRLVKGPKEQFFARDPIATLERLVPTVVGTVALSAKDIKARVESAATGHGQLLSEWLKGAVGRGLLFEQAPRSARGKTKTFSTRPDLRLLLKKSLAGLKAELCKADAAGLSRADVAQFLATEVGASSAGLEAAASGPDVQREQFLRALRQLESTSPPGALLSVRELRADAALDKRQFDAMALALSREGAIVLHHHDHAGALPEAERALLVEDARGTHYVGIALRRPS
jgi:hypothetical protein